MNRVTNPAKLRRIRQLLGAEPIYATRHDSRHWLVFTDKSTAWLVPRNDAYSVERYLPEDHNIFYEDGLHYETLLIPRSMTETEYQRRIDALKRATDELKNALQEYEE